jgi:hypothetical protein
MWVCRDNWMLRGPQLPILMIIGSMLAISVLSSANPMVPPPPPDTTFALTDPLSGIAWLFVINIIVNLFWFSALLLASFKRFGRNLGALPARRSRFMTGVLSVGFFVTFLGAIIDYYIVAQERYLELSTGLGDYRTGYFRVLSFDAGNWSIALALIFASVVLSSYIFLRLSHKPNLVIAGVMTAMNPVWWVLVDLFGEAASFLTVLVGMLCVPILLRWLLNMHEAMYHTGLGVPIVQGRVMPDADRLYNPAAFNPTRDRPQGRR